MSFFKNTPKNTSSEISFSLPFSSSNLKVCSKRVQKVKMVLNSSVKRNVSTKNIEEVGDRERREGRIFAYASGAGAKRGGGLRGRGRRRKVR